MKRIKNLIEDHKRCYHLRHEHYIKWCIKFESKDIPACSIFFIPTFVYNTYPYRYNDTFIFNVYFLHWYIGIGKWCLKKDEKSNYL